MSRAQQLPLMLSLADSATLQQDCHLATSYAREMAMQANGLREENARLRNALKTAQARTLDLQRELIFAQTLAKTWEAEVKLWRRDREQVPHPTLDKNTLLDLVKLAHPDLWQHQPAETLAHEISIVLNELRSRRQGVA